MLFDDGRKVPFFPNAIFVMGRTGNHRDEANRFFTDGMLHLVPTNVSTPQTVKIIPHSITSECEFCSQPASKLVVFGISVTDKNGLLYVHKFRDMIRWLSPAVVSPITLHNLNQNDHFC